MRRHRAAFVYLIHYLNLSSIEDLIDLECSASASCLDLMKVEAATYSSGAFHFVIELNIRRLKGQTVGYLCCFFPCSQYYPN